MSLPEDRFIRISDPDDARVEAFRDIRERDLVGRKGRFVAEGTVVLRMLARSKTFRADKILVLENRVEGVSGLLAQFGTDVPIMVCSRSVIDAIAGFPMHRGVLAIGRTSQPAGLEEAVGALGDDALVLVCSAIANHDNLGSLFRNAAAFSADLLCLDAQCCNPLYRKSVRVSVGSVLTMPYTQEGSIDDIVRVLAEAGIDVVALSPDGGERIEAFRPGRRTALVVGTEGEGLSKPLLARLKTVRIPQDKDLDSLNVATAAAIAMYCVAARQGRI